MIKHKMLKLTKKQKKINKKNRYLKSKTYLKKLEKQERIKKDKEWSDLVKNRDMNKCVICSRTDFIHTHHIFPRENKEFRWTVDNGVVLCAKHHKYSFEISAHKNSLIFILWLQKNRKEQLDRLLKERIKNP